MHRVATQNAETVIILFIYMISYYTKYEAEC